ncbi:hypothetical protein [Vibrio diazotrophicus]|uniref:hypothetical protein n=1 Tax=Vibrio diazotrophicus TaxID=685 RepID=UPI00142E1CC9|nr:hypothetical protein [Vibrio diazotrophicus]NIY91412.1 hypothetical protein [Vibrio diazotrophicus]
MNKSLFPFVAGQRTDKLFDSSHVLSPLPIKTLLPRAKQCDQLIKKNEHYIDLGGAGGMIFQTQLMWMIFLMGFFSFLWFFVPLGGFYGIYKEGFRGSFVNGEWQQQFSMYDFFMAIFITFAPLCLSLVINYKVVTSARAMLSQTIPCRFHRQRREVLFSRWNKELKKIETRAVPWEKVCVMVGQGASATTGGVVSSASLVIAVNDEENYGNFWSALRIGAIDKFHAASIWEMIRTFMEQGADAIGEPAPLTLDGIIEQHCQAHKVKREEFSNATKFWWYINGTMLGIWRVNYEMRKLNQRTEAFTEVEAWSKPLPESEWQQPSAQLNHVNDMLARNEYAQGHTILSIGDACARYMQREEVNIK